MHIKIRKQNTDGTVRLETAGDIKEILIQEDFLNPDKESIHLCFQGKNSSGIVELSTKEFESLYQQIKSNIHMIKSFKVLKEWIQWDILWSVQHQLNNE